MGAFLLGAAAIVVSSSIAGGLSRAAPLLPVLVMLIYCVLIWEGGKVSEEAGDSLYYLGFAFTLVALIVAMAGALFNQEAIELRLIVRAFGIALSTTVIGLVGRVVLLSFVDDWAGREPQEVAYDDAMTALQELQVEVRETVQTLSDWRNDAAEHWRSVRQEEMRGVQEALAAHQGLLSDQAAEFQTRLADAYSGLEKYSEEAISKIKWVAEEATAGVKQVALSGVGEVGAVAAAAQGEIVGSFSGLSQQLGEELVRTQAGVDQASASFRSAVVAFQDSTREAQQAVHAALSAWALEFGKAAETVGADVSKQMEGGFVKVVEASGLLAESVAGAAQRLSGVRFDGINQALQESQNQIVNGFSALSQKASGLGDGFEDIKSSVQGLAQSMALHKDSISTTGEALARVSGDLSRAAQNVSVLVSALENMGAQLAADPNEIGELRRQLGAAREAMTQDLLSSQRALRTVMGTLTEGVRQLRGEIESRGPR